MKEEIELARMQRIELDGGGRFCCGNEGYEGKN